MRAHVRAGVTLAELMVVIVILGVMAGVATVAVRRATPLPGTDPALATLSAARRAALTDGTPRTITVAVDGVRYLATVYPDGRIVTPAPLGLDRLAGRPADVGR